MSYTVFSTTHILVFNNFQAYFNEQKVSLGRVGSAITLFDGLFIKDMTRFEAQVRASFKNLS